MHVSPTLVKIGAPLAEVRGAFNAISVVGDAVGPLMFHGQGAGQMPTASAVVADMIDMVVGRAQITFRNLELWTDQASAARPLNPDKATGKYYLRIMAADKPGVLAEIAGELGRHKISIASVIQHDDERTDDGFLPLVIMTHTATEGDVLAAIDAIDQFPSTKPFCVRMRVQD